MPQSKNGKLYFTKEQYDFARYETSALEYAKAQGYTLVEKGKYVCLQEHDSMVFTQNGAWFWNSMNMRGGALEFMMAYEGRTLVEAVLILNGEDLSQYQIQQRPAAKLANFSVTKNQSTLESLPFELPPKAQNYKRLYAYLEGTRGISDSVLSRMVKDEILYESAEPLHDSQREIHNCVFVTRDENNTPTGAFKRGTSTKSSFKIEVRGSSKEIPFSMPVDNKANVLAIFEAAIDAASHASIYEMSGKNPFSIHRIATGGTPHMEAIQRYLNSHPEITEIWLGQDNDAAGEKQREMIENWVKQNLNIKVSRVCPMQNCKDWNDMLLVWRQTIRQSVEEQMRTRRRGCEFKIHILREDGKIQASYNSESLDDLKQGVKKASEMGQPFVLETPQGYKAAIRGISYERNRAKQEQQRGVELEGVQSGPVEVEELEP